MYSICTTPLTTLPNPHPTHSNPTALTGHSETQITLDHLSSKVTFLYACCPDALREAGQYCSGNASVLTGGSMAAAAAATAASFLGGGGN